MTGSAWGTSVGLIVLAYLVGSLSPSVFLGRAFKGVDVRTLGSGNLGATNVYRSLGRGIGVATLVLDIAKGALPVWLVPATRLGAAVPGGAAWCAIAVGFAAVAGHPATEMALVAAYKELRDC